MIQSIKSNLEANGFASVDISELFPIFDFNDWLTALSDSWNVEKSTFWNYKNNVLGRPDLDNNISPEDLSARRKLIEEEFLEVDQQFWELNLNPNLMVAELGEEIKNLVEELFPKPEEKDLHLHKQVTCLTMDDFISPQLLTDKVCQVIVYISDLDPNSIQGGEVTIGDNAFKPKKGTVFIVDSKLPVGVNAVKDSQHRFVFRVTVNTFTPTPAL
jgi:hypothetical protein